MTKRCELYLRIPAALVARPDAGTMVLNGPAAAILITAAPNASVPLGPLRNFVASASSQNIAVLIENDARLAKELDASGVHLRAHIQTLRDARALLGGDKLIGVSCSLSRHEAMLLGEEGADYVAFGETLADDPVSVADMIRWWDEIFEIASVAWARDDYDDSALRMLVSAGADYLAVPADRRVSAAILEGGLGV